MNECEAQRCSQECTNIYGSYQCYCRQGYQLAEDGHTCTGTSPLPRGPLPERHLFPVCQAPRDSLLGWGRKAFSVKLELDSQPCSLLGHVTLGSSSVKWR